MKDLKDIEKLDEQILIEKAIAKEVRRQQQRALARIYMYERSKRVKV